MTTTIGGAIGTIATPGNSGWFQVQLTAGTQYVFDVGNGTLADPLVTLYDSSGNPLVAGVAGAGPNGQSETSYTATASGTYFIGASSIGSGTGSYHAALSTVPYGYAANTATTGTLAVGGQVSGAIVATGQSEWFALNLTAGTQYVVTQGSGALGAANLTFYDFNGNAVVTNNANGATVASFEPASSGTYYLGVSSTTHSGTGTFSLSASTAAYDYAGTVNTAGVVAVGGPPVTGVLTTPGQGDWFQVQLAANVRYVFDVVGQGGLTQPTVALYDTGGDVVIPQTVGGGSAANDSRISFLSATGGTYFVAASGSASQTGAFTVAATTASEAYADTIYTTGTIALSTPAAGTINVTGDSNWFAITLNAGTQYVFDVTNGTLKASQIAVFDSNAIQFASGLAGNPNGGAETSFDPTATGTYFVAVSGQGSNTGTYTVGVSTVPTPSVSGNVNTTGTVAVGGQVTGSFNKSGESNWYQVQLTAGTLYVFDAGSDTLTDPQVTLYNSYGQLLEQGNAGAAGGIAQTVYDPSASGTYFVAAASQSSNVGTFTISVATAAVGVLTAPPVLVTQTANVGAVVGQPVGIPSVASAFTDPGGLPLTLSATLTNGQALPSWLSFNAANGTFSGTVPTSAVGQTLSVAVTATDTVGVSTTEIFAVYGETANVAAFVATENAHGRGANGIAPMVPNATGSATVDGVVGFQAMAFSGGNNAVVLDGPRSQYIVQVATNGSTQITDKSNSQTVVTVTGESYLIFNGGSASAHTSNGTPLYDQEYLVLSPLNAEVALIYAAALNRPPDLPGLEYWENQVASGMSLYTLAAQFVDSSEFYRTFPAASGAPDNGGAHDTAFVTQLYETVLGRAPDVAGLVYWVGLLAAGQAPGGGGITRYEVLAQFAVSAENQLNIDAVVPGGSGYLIVSGSNPGGSTGGYADGSVPLTAPSVLSTAATSHFLNTNLIATGFATTTVGNVTLSSTGVLTDGNANDIIVLSPAIHTVTVNGGGDTIVSPVAGGALITDSNGSNKIRLTGTGNVINYAANDTITGYQAGADHLSSSTTMPNLYAPTASAMLNGHMLTQGANNIVNIGNIGGGPTATQVAAAINAVFVPADVANETVTFYGQTGTDTTIYKWVNTATPTATVTAAELTTELTLIGITATTLTAADFHS